MPERYQIEVEPTESRLEPVFKLSSIEKDRCLGCLDCAKRDCVYEVYENRRFLPDQLVYSTDSRCKLCLRCVQECHNQILVKMLNPEYVNLGDEYWTPEIITSLWHQAGTGKIPVSGTGYGGHFSGTGFDDMWTDMSEIVRPTRDGIHGREYISTSIDLGRKPDFLNFRNNRLAGELPPNYSIPLPVILDIPPRGRSWAPVRKSIIAAGRRCRLPVLSDGKKARGAFIVPRHRPGEKIEPATTCRMIEIFLDSPSPPALKSAEATVAALQKTAPGTVVWIGLPLKKGTKQNVLRLARAGIGAVHLYAGHHGKENDNGSGAFIKEAVRDIHLALVEESLRDRVSLLAGGGIAQAEHVAKLIACGADGAVIDEALLVALECRMCFRCLGENRCQWGLEKIDPAWGTQRITNLLGSWHAQLIEVLGAMGLREVRRLRGEVGRVMFFSELEEECFAPIFGNRKARPD